MRVALATEPGTPDWPNEDFAAIAPGAAVLLDGATTTPRGADTGCAHGVAWYARTLGTVLLGAITVDPPAPLAAGLAGAIAEVRAQHASTCDLTSPATPAATVTAVRAAPAGVEVLALSDSVVIADYSDGRPPLVITDTHAAASTSPDAAHRARATTLPFAGLRGIAMLSDGATRITDSYELLGWPALLAVVRDDGPAELIRQVRAAEDTDPQCTRWPRGKARDDATVIYWYQPALAPGQRLW
jgi:Protein phosphatase 2C